MGSFTRNIVVACLVYAALVSGFALWQRQQIRAAHRASLEEGVDRYAVVDDAMRRLGAGAVGALALTGALGLASYALLVRRGREVTVLLQDALAGQQLPAPRVKDDFAAALEAAGRVGQELNLERERGAQARHRLHTLSRLVDVGVLLINPSRQLEFANPRDDPSLSPDRSRRRLFSHM